MDDNKNKEKDFENLLEQKIKFLKFKEFDETKELLESTKELFTKLEKVINKLYPFFRKIFHKRKELIEVKKSCVNLNFCVIFLENNSVRFQSIDPDKFEFLTVEFRNGTIIYKLRNNPDKHTWRPDHIPEEGVVVYSYEHLIESTKSLYLIELYNKKLKNLLNHISLYMPKDENLGEYILNNLE
jgi:hypothetical protein